MKVKIGSTIGNWKIISERYKENNIYWNDCECICGITRPVRNWHLNHNMTKGCGCSNIKGRFKYQGYNDLSLAYYNTFKSNRVKNRNKYFSDKVTLEYLWDLFIRQNKKCALSGVDITLNPKWSEQNKTGQKHLQTASIDRIDSNKGYEIGNVQWVHKNINWMKGKLDENIFIEMCKKVANYKS